MTTEADPVPRPSSKPQGWDEMTCAFCGGILAFLATGGYHGYLILSGRCSSMDPFLRFVVELSAAAVGGGLLFYALAAIRNRVVRR